MFEVTIRSRHKLYTSIENLERQKLFDWRELKSRILELQNFISHVYSSLAWFVMKANTNLATLHFKKVVTHGAEWVVSGWWSTLSEKYLTEKLIGIVQHPYECTEPCLIKYFIKWQKVMIRISCFTYLHIVQDLRTARSWQFFINDYDNVFITSSVLIKLDIRPFEAVHMIHQTKSQKQTSHWGQCGEHFARPFSLLFSSFFLYFLIKQLWKQKPVYFCFCF